VLVCLALPLSWAKSETWVEVRSPNFIVVSNAGEGEARRTAVQFERIRNLYHQTIMAISGSKTPVVTVLAVKDEYSLRELMPEYWEKGREHLVGLFAKWMHQDYAALRLDITHANLAYPYAPIYHEYYHVVSAPYFRNLPLWLIEGLADFYGHAEFVGKEAHVGLVDVNVLNSIRRRGLIPLDILFKVDYSSPYYRNENDVPIFYEESWALTHYLLAGDNQAHRQLLIDYVNALSQGATEEQAAEKAFGDLKTLQDQLYHYVDRTTFYFIKVPAPEDSRGPELSARTLTEAEVDAYRGGFSSVRGRTDDAIKNLEEAVRLDPKLALAYQNLALAEFRRGQRDEAFTAVSKAIDIDPKNSYTRYFRAFLTLNKGGSSAQGPQVEEDLRQSVAVDPDFAPANNILASYLSSQNRNLNEAATFAEKAISLDPGDSNYHLNLATLFMQLRKYDEAQTASLNARSAAKSTQERDRADHLLAEIERKRTDRGSSNNVSDPPKSSEATGLVTESKCAGGLQLDVTTSSGSLHFHTAPGANLKMSVASQPPPGYNPCTWLKGQRVTVEFQPDDDKIKGGTINSLKVLGPVNTSASSP
jgi:tetratricopeptide (TPR) repeat protein